MSLVSSQEVVSNYSFMKLVIELPLMRQDSKCGERVTRANVDFRSLGDSFGFRNGVGFRLLLPEYSCSRLRIVLPHPMNETNASSGLHCNGVGPLAFTYPSDVKRPICNICRNLKFESIPKTINESFRSAQNNSDVRIFHFY